MCTPASGKHISSIELSTLRSESGCACPLVLAQSSRLISSLSYRSATILVACKLSELMPKGLLQPDSVFGYLALFNFNFFLNVCSPPKVILIHIHAPFSSVQSPYTVKALNKSSSPGTVFMTG